MRRFLRAVCLLAALLPFGLNAHAQGLIPISIEGRGGYAVPQGDWNENDGLENGFGYGINLRLQVLPLISLYGGWDKFSFEVDGFDEDATDAGLHLGGQLSAPLSAMTGMSPFVFAGLVYNRTSLAVEGAGVSLEVESDDAFGYEAGAGVAFPLAPTLTLTPQVRYRNHPAEFTIAGNTNETTVSYVAFDVGLKLGI